MIDRTIGLSDPRRGVITDPANSVPARAQTRESIRLEYGEYGSLRGYRRGRRSFSGPSTPFKYAESIPTPTPTPMGFPVSLLSPSFLPPFSPLPHLR
jgi:hypothetical protein